METIVFSKLGSIATIGFNRPQAMNAFNHIMAQELLVATNEIKADTAIRAVLLSGMGKLFMAGGDIQFFHQHLATMPHGVSDIVENLNQVIHNLMTMPKPVLASVHGSAAGVGVSLMLACDLVMASEDTKFTMAYSGLGISPDGGASFNLPRNVGMKKAMEWLLLPDLFSAAEAKAHGLINWVVPAAELEAATQKCLARLAAGPSFSYAHIKQLLQASLHNTLDAQLELEKEAFIACTTSDDFATGVKSFLQKQKPEFVGK